MLCINVGVDFPEPGNANITAALIRNLEKLT